MRECGGARSALAIAVLSGALACGSSSSSETTCSDNLNCAYDGGTGEAGKGDAKSDGASKPDAKGDAKTDGKPSKDGGTDGTTGVDAADASDAQGDTSACDGTKPPSAESCVISETYGVFVAPAASGGSDSNPGTRAMPFATIGAAITHAGSKRVYVCGATYAESVSVTSGVSVYGGLACPLSAGSDAGAGGVGAWSYTGTVAQVSPSAVGFALQVNAGNGAHFEDMGFTAQDASAATAGASSIAVMVNGSTGVSFTRVTATSGAGTAGTSAGTPSTNWCATSGQGGSVTTNDVGGNSGTCTCLIVVADTSNGGIGGDGNASTPTNGLGGQSTPLASPMGIQDGKGGTPAVISGGVVTAACMNGDNGARGATLAAGTAGAPGALGSTGWSPQIAGAGFAGDPGQGGGGGGGGQAIGGAGGGAGGCGGNGGGGGSGGGASLAIAVVNATVSLTQVTLSTGAGGAGGSGAAGEAGQAGGNPGLEVGCNGGAGGPGAGGSGGGGGAGGPSVGVAVTGASASVTIDGASATAPVVSLSSPSTFTSGGGGAAGGGGTAGAASGTGVAGNTGTPGPIGSSDAVVAF